MVQLGEEERAMEEADRQERRKDFSSWSIKKEFSIGDIIAVTASAIAVLGAWYSIDKRLTVVEDRMVQQKVVDVKQDATHAETKIELREILKEMRTDIRAIRDKVR